MKKQIAEFIVNGRAYEVLIEPRMTLLELLRDKLDLSGTKQSCGIGSCGACTVLVDGKAVDSCLTLAITVKGKNILTIEGLANGASLHPIQKAFIDHGAIQCGFCTPGMIMSAKALVDKNPHPTRDQVKEALEGNLCRCTGYVKIIDAVLAAADTMKKGEKCHD
jgi:carbon-monoxide dehydrogenase small subunit